MSDTTTNTKVVALPSPAYDIFKFIALIVLPAVGALYSGLSGLWNLPNPVAVVGTITLVDTFLGTVLKISSSQYASNAANAANTLVSSSQAGTLTITGYNDVTGHPDLALRLDPTKVVTEGGVANQVTLTVDDQSGVTPPPLNTNDPEE